MELFNETLKRVEAQEMIRRFSSKDDIQGILTQLGKYFIVYQKANLDGILLPFFWMEENLHFQYYANKRSHSRQMRSTIGDAQRFRDLREYDDFMND